MTGEAKGNGLESKHEDRERAARAAERELAARRRQLRWYLLLMIVPAGAAVALVVLSPPVDTRLAQAAASEVRTRVDPLERELRAGLEEVEREQANTARRLAVVDEVDLPALVRDLRPSRLRDMETRMEALEARPVFDAALGSRVQELDGRMAQQDRRLSEQAETIDGLRSRIQESPTPLAELEALRERLEERETTVEKLEKEVERQSRQLREQAVQIQGLRERVDASGQQSPTLELKQLKQLLERQQRQLSDLEKKVGPGPGGKVTPLHVPDLQRPRD